MQSNYKRLGEYIREVNIRNKDLNDYPLLGVSIQKVLMPSIANIIGTDMSTYKLIKKNQFAYGPVTSRNGDKISIALADKYENALLSQAYTVFEVIDENELHPEYLMMWFKRPEFDRYARFMSHGSAREIFSWAEMCDTLLPIPSPEKQLEIVREYNVIQNRIKLNNQLIAKLEETAQTIYKQWFVDFEFPNENGLPYKSNGGEMVDSELGEIPKGWGYGVVGDLFTFQRGHDLPSQNRKNGKYPIIASTGIAAFHNEYKINKPTIITGRSGSLGELFFFDQPCWPLNTTLYIVKFKNSKPSHALYLLQTINLKEMGAGSAVPTLNRNDIHALGTVIPTMYIIELFEINIKNIYSLKENYNNQKQRLLELKEIILSKMTKIEMEKELA